MGIRSSNYLVLSVAAMAGKEMTVLVKDLLDDPVETREDASLFSFESNISPLWARDAHRSVLDLRQELELQEYLNQFAVTDFRLLRDGDQPDHRGQWLAHPFSQDPDILEFESAPVATA